MSSNKMSQRTQIKRSKTKRSVDKMDKAMNDVKKIGIISCCLIAVLIVIGIFINTEESYATDFLVTVPEQFTSVISTGPGNYQILIEGNVYVNEENPSVYNNIELPKNFSGQQADGTFISYIYCMDRRLGMGKDIYVKGNSVKAQNDIAPETNGIEALDVTADYPGLIYILQNHERLGGNAEQNYYYTQLAVWWYVDRANGLLDTKNYNKHTGLEVEDTDIEISSEDKYEEDEEGYPTYRFLNNLSVLDKKMLENNSIGQSIKQLVDEAEAHESDYTGDKGSIDINIDENNITYTVNNDYIETNLIRPTSSNSTFESYSVQVNNAVGNIEIVDENNNPLDASSISASQGFKLRVPLSELNGEAFKANITIAGYFKDYYDAYIYNPPEGSELQRALLGLIERPSTPITLDLEAPTLNVPDTASTSYLVYGIGALVIIAGIVLIVVAKRPNNAKKK